MFLSLIDSSSIFKIIDLNNLNKCTIRKHRIENVKKNQLINNMYPNIPDGPVNLDKNDKNDKINSKNDIFLFKHIKCYVCKNRFNKLHHFYDTMCTECGDFNYDKRFQTCDMKDKYCLITGGRVKIGFYTALKLLRAGANVIITTRFLNDAVLRFSNENDYDEWKDRLCVCFLNLCNIHSVELFCEKLYEKIPRLDVIINNACQTIRREPEYYYSLLKNEINNCLTDNSSQMVRKNTDELLSNFSLYPENLVDTNGQQIDMRKNNSWNTKLCDVSTVELAEVFIINSIAPTIINSKLRNLMNKKEDSYIINVSSMEGKFNKHKISTHPHTNMAKAALNMMTKTCGKDFVKDNIYMTSVDTGWVSNEYSTKKAEESYIRFNFIPPLDEIDGASRILDPIFNKKKLHSVFLKDYSISNW